MNFRNKLLGAGFVPLLTMKNKNQNNLNECANAEEAAEQADEL